MKAIPSHESFKPIPLDKDVGLLSKQFMNLIYNIT